VEGSGEGYLKTVCDYVDLNPARARLVAAEEPLRAYRWSSLPEYLRAASTRVPWLRLERLFGEYRIPQDNAAGRREFEAAVEARWWQEKGDAFKGVRRGWCLGASSSGKTCWRGWSANWGRCISVRNGRRARKRGRSTGCGKGQASGGDGDEPGGAPERGSGEGAVGAAATGGDDGDAGMDRPAAADGQCGVPDQPPVPAAEGEVEVGSNRT
jgi:hypothetical protein